MKQVGKKIILDLWFHFQPEHETITIMCTSEDGQDYSLAQLSMTWEEYESKDYEDLYNLCLEVANDLGYHLAGQVENDYFMYRVNWDRTHDEGVPACFEEWYYNEYQEEY